MQKISKIIFYLIFISFFLPFLTLCTYKKEPGSFLISDSTKSFPDSSDIIPPVLDDSIVNNIDDTLKINNIDSSYLAIQAPKKEKSILAKFWDIITIPEDSRYVTGFFIAIIFPFDFAELIFPLDESGVDFKELIQSFFIFLNFILTISAIILTLRKREGKIFTITLTSIVSATAFLGIHYYLRVSNNYDNDFLWGFWIFYSLTAINFLIQLKLKLETKNP